MATQNKAQNLRVEDMQATMRHNKVQETTNQGMAGQNGRSSSNKAVTYLSHNGRPPNIRHKGDKDCYSYSRPKPLCKQCAHQNELNGSGHEGENDCSEHHCYTARACKNTHILSHFCTTCVRKGTNFVLYCMRLHEKAFCYSPDKRT